MDDPGPLYTVYNLDPRSFFLPLFTQRPRETVWKIAEGVSARLSGGKRRPNRDSFDPLLAALGAPIRDQSRISKQFQKGNSQKFAKKDSKITHLGEVRGSGT